MNPLESLLKQWPTPWHVVKLGQSKILDYAVCAAQSAADEYVVRDLEEDEARTVVDAVNTLKEERDRYHAVLDWIAGADDADGLDNVHPWCKAARKALGQEGGA
jgi:hypothetical protein